MAIGGISLACASSAANLAAQDQADLQRVRARAAFALQCDAARVSTTVLERQGGSFVTAVGAEGCGRRAVYVRNLRDDTWLMEPGAGLQAAPVAR